MPQRDRVFRLGLFRSAGVNLTMPAVEMRHFLGRPASAPPRAYEKQDPFNEGRMIVGFFPATTMPDADWWQALWPDPAKVLVDMGVQPGMVVVDLCCGDGLFTAPLGRIADTIYAVDIDPAMLDRARAFVAAAGTTNCHFVLADAMTFRCRHAGAGRLRLPRKHLSWRPGSVGLGASRRGILQFEDSV